jgi:DNA-directed RNA polymerase subunit RPC12/RpoP
MIHYACPACETHLSSPDAHAGTKLPCPTCGQRLRVPAVVNHTVLARPLPPSAGDAQPAQAQPDRPLDVLEVVEGDRDNRPRPRWCCRECGYRGRPLVRPKMADAGIALTIAGIVCWPLIVAGVLLKDDYEVCPDCGTYGDKVNGPHF